MNRVAAKKPISWTKLVELMEALGYDGLSLNNERRVARFFGDSETIEEFGLPRSVTVNFPTFVGVTEKVDSYEVDYVVDLIEHMSGRQVDGVFKLIMKRQLN